MSYSNPLNITYSFGNFDFGGGTNETLAVQAPAGKTRGRLIEIGVATSEAFATTSGDATVQVGASGDTDAYGLLVIPDTTADAVYVNSRTDTDAIISEEIDDDKVVVTLSYGVDVSLTGQGHVFVTIAWF